MLFGTEATATLIAAIHGAVNELADDAAKGLPSAEAEWLRPVAGRRCSSAALSACLRSRAVRLQPRLHGLPGKGTSVPQRTVNSTAKMSVVIQATPDTLNAASGRLGRSWRARA